MTRGIFTPPAAAPRASTIRNQLAMAKALSEVETVKATFDACVLKARNLQARHIVDALFSRYEYQIKLGNTTLSFGDWLIKERSLQATYAVLTIEVVLWAYEGLVHEILTDERFRLFDEQKRSYDWLTPLIQHYVNHRVDEEGYTIEVISDTEVISTYATALHTLKFRSRRRIPGYSTNL